VFDPPEALSNQETRMTRLRLLLAAAAALGLSACAQKAEPPDFAAGTPDTAGLTLETAGDAGDGLAPSAAPGALSAGPMIALPAACQDWEFTCKLRESISGVNHLVRAALEPVEALVASGPASDPSDDVRVYGPLPLPAAAPVASWRLTVKSMGNETFRWKLEAQAIPPAGAPFHTVMAGQLRRGDVPHRGRGIVGIDLDELYAVNPARFPGQGKLLAAFAHVGLQKALVYAAQEFSADGIAVPVSAIFTGWKDALGRARVRLAAVRDFVPASAAADQDELLLSRAGYWPALGGRTAVAVLGGNVPDYGYAGFEVKAFVGLECFGPGLNVTYRAEFYCGTNTSAIPHVNECHPETTFNDDPSKAVGIDPDDLDDGPINGACDLIPGVYDPVAGVGTNDSGSTELEPGAPAQPDAPPTAMPSF
jgi:hypothetical protein